MVLAQKQKYQPTKQIRESRNKLTFILWIYFQHWMTKISVRLKVNNNDNNKILIGTLTIIKKIKLCIMSMVMVIEVRFVCGYAIC
jgi:hypothetical protein